MVLAMRSFTMVVARNRGTGASKSRSSVHKGACRKASHTFKFRGVRV